MKLTQRQIKRIIKEELENTLEEGAIDFIKRLFGVEQPFPGMTNNFNANKEYEEGTYGHFAQSQQVLSKLQKNNIKATAKTIAAAGEELLGTGGGPVSSLSALGMAIMGVIGSKVIAGALGILGVATAAIGVVRLFRKNPTAVEKFPQLKVFHFDPKWEEIIDDDLEAELLNSYEKYFLLKLKNNPDHKIVSFNDFVQKKLKSTKNQRTLHAPGNPV